jgi:hypothetical protein
MLELKDVGEVVATRDITLDETGKVTVHVSGNYECANLTTDDVWLRGGR